MAHDIMHFVRYQIFVDTHCLHLDDGASRWRQ